jgi:peptide chain release factor 2
VSILEKYEINKYLEKFHNSVNDLNLALDSVSLEKKLKELNELILEPSFWDDSKKSNKVIAELNVVKEKVNTISEVNKGYDDIKELYEMYTLDESEEMKELLEEEILNFNTLVEETTIKVILNGEYDDNDVILEIHPGAGGTESMDWADMLFRMYQRYCQKHNFKFKVIDYLAGEEAGIKSVTITISGKNAYGMLKGERGVHRLVRISPFDTNKRRHTSFASVDISPVIKDMAEVKINEADLKIDTFCSSGPGGQGVNTTYSAVRITHKPTGIVVNCQNERSQIQNREQAMIVLQSKLMELEIQKKEEELAKIKGGSSAIAFGSQIRSYVFCPYTLVKDHRSNVENGNVSAVMDGELDSFIYGYLKWMCNK